MNVVLTTLLTKEVDPMRGRKWVADPSILETWAASITGATPFVLADELSAAPHGAGLVALEPLGRSGGPYFNRWVHCLQWLNDSPWGVDWVWITDGSDVVMLREPWDQMSRGVLYLGSEEQIVGCGWMRNPTHHPTPTEQLFIDTHHESRLFNAGLVGGDASTVRSFLSAMVQGWAEAGFPAMSDMAIFNMTAYSRPVPPTTGERVHTTFGAQADNGIAWWQHK